MPSLRRNAATTTAKGASTKAAGPANAGKAAAKGGPTKPSRGARASQLKQAFSLTRKSDPRMVPLVLGAFLVPFALLLALGFLVVGPFYLGLLGVLLGLVAATAVFGRRVQKTAFSQVEGQVGAGAAVLTNMRGDWRVTPAVGFTREQDMVHRVLGRPGIVLVAEGAGGRTKNLIATEKKRLARFIGDTPIYDVRVGDGEGEIPLRQLERHFLKLPRNIKPKRVNDLDGRLKAIGAAQPLLPIPKGPMPKGGRVPRGKPR